VSCKHAHTKDSTAQHCTAVYATALSSA
jgi:hypothetical protein